MTNAERQLLCAIADTLLDMARNPVATADTTRLAEARRVLVDEAAAAQAFPQTPDWASALEGAHGIRNEEMWWLGLANRAQGRAP